VAFSELERFIDQKLNRYSSGMQVRLAFSVAIHANREILLMDEVLAVGDSTFQSKCLEEFNKYKDQNKTVILVSHDVYTVQKYCTQAMLVRNGKIVRIGQPSDVVSEYISENISDDEKRKSIEEKIMPADNKFKKNTKGVADILEINFMDGNGKLRNIFETGKLLVVEVIYEIFEEIDDPIFGIIIRDGMKNNVFALNTQFKNMKIGRLSPGIRKVRFEIENYFSTGNYSVSPAIAEKTEKIIDWKDNFKNFEVINQEFTSNAIADFKTKIIIE